MNMQQKAPQADERWKRDVEDAVIEALERAWQEQVEEVMGKLALGAKGDDWVLAWSPPDETWLSHDRTRVTGRLWHALLMPGQTRMPDGMAKQRMVLTATLGQIRQHLREHRGRAH